MRRPFRRRVHDRDRHRRLGGWGRSSILGLQPEHHPPDGIRRLQPDDPVHRGAGNRHLHRQDAGRIHLDAAQPGPVLPDEVLLDAERPDEGCRSAKPPGGCSCPACWRMGCYRGAGRLGAASPGCWRMDCCQDELRLGAESSGHPECRAGRLPVSPRRGPPPEPVRQQQVRVRQRQARRGLQRPERGPRPEPGPPGPDEPEHSVRRPEPA